jgi:hypothetical protein
MRRTKDSGTNLMRNRLIKIYMDKTLREAPKRALKGALKVARPSTPTLCLPLSALHSPVESHELR